MADAPIRTWRLDDHDPADGPRQTMVLAATADRLPQVVHWGAPLPAGEDLETLARAAAIDVTGGMLDAPPT